jgi:hypothetical protein
LCFAFFGCNICIYYFIKGLTISPRSVMSQKSIDEIAEGFGLSVEPATIPEHERAFRVLKGANQIFIGTEDAVRIFLGGYEKDRPGMFEGSMYGYME